MLANNELRRRRLDNASDRQLLLSALIAKALDLAQLLTFYYLDTGDKIFWSSALAAAQTARGQCRPRDNAGISHVRQGGHMSDWDFLHDMQNDGYSPEQIADAAACGYNPWEWEPIRETELPAVGPLANPKLVMIFESVVENAKSYDALTGRYLQIWGELGEFFAEVKYGIKRNKPHTKGSDGRLGNDFVEVKTISRKKVTVKFKSNAPAISTNYL